MLKIDAFPHILPRNVLERMLAVVPNGPAKHWVERTQEMRGLDTEERLRAMDAYDEYRQVLTLAAPPLEQVAQGQAGQDLCALANDTLAGVCHRYPDRFAGFAAALPMDDADAAVRELDRAITQLGALGIQIFTNADGHSLDEPRFEPLFSRMAELDRPIWVHGARSFDKPDFVGEDGSRYGLWLAFGWPYEMAVFMARAAVSGLLDRYPNLRILTHHGGGMVPTFGHRFGPGPMRNVPAHPDEFAAFQRLQKQPLEYLHMFYADTTVGIAPIALRATLAFFGIGRVLFATDMPYGGDYAQRLIQLLESMDFPEQDLQQLFAGNAQRILGI